MYLNMCWQTHPIKAITENASQHLNTKPFASQGRQKSISNCDIQTPPPPWQWWHKMHLIKCWQNTSIASEDTKHISTRLNKLIPWQRGHKMNLNLCWPNPSYENENTKCIPTCVDQTHPNTAKTQNASHQTSPMTVRTQTGCQHMLTKHVPCMRGHKNLKISWPNIFHDSKDTKCISTCVEHIPAIPTNTQRIMTARTQNSTQHILTKTIPSKRTHKSFSSPLHTSHDSEHTKLSQIKLIKNPSHNSEDTKCFRTCLDQSPPMPARTQNEPQLCWRNPPQANEDAKCVTLSWPNPFLHSKDTKFIPTYVHQTSSMTVRAQNEAQIVLTKPPSPIPARLKYISTWLEQTLP